MTRTKYNRRCSQSGCEACPMYNFPGLKIARFCNIHKEPSMINIRTRRRRCCVEGCFIHPNFNYPGNSPAMFCVTHKEEEMINIYKRQRTLNKSQKNHDIVSIKNSTLTKVMSPLELEVLDFLEFQIMKSFWI